MAAADRLVVTIVRHGLTAWNVERRYQGQRDIPLLLPDAMPGLDRLRDYLRDYQQREGEFDAIHVSDLARCRQTLAHALEAHEHRAPCSVEPRLREMDFGDFEGKCYEELEQQPAYRAWIDSQGEQAPPNGESAAMLRARLSAWFGELLAKADSDNQRQVLVVTHGGVIRELRRRFESIDFWDGRVTQAEGRRWIFERSPSAGSQGESQGKSHGEPLGAWQCSYSSAVPTPVSVR